MKGLIKGGVVRITPEIASDWLESKNSHNRTISAKSVNQYARDMADGNWFNNGIPITFNEDTEELVDGQHRLAAIVKSGVTLDLRVNFVPSSEAKGFDINRVRSTRDVLIIENNIDNTVLTSVSCISLSKFILSIKSDGNFDDAGHRYSPSVVEDFITNNKDLLLKYYSIIPKRTLFSAPESAAILSALKNGYSEETLIQYVNFMQLGYSEHLKGIGWISVRDRKLKNVMPFVNNRGGASRKHPYLATQYLLHRAEMGVEFKRFRDYYIGEIYYNWHSDKEE